VISTGAITRRASEERLPALTIERDYVHAQLCADIGAAGDSRLVFKGGTLLRLCYFNYYRYSADVDFSAIDGLSAADGVDIVATATATCRDRLELPTLELINRDRGGGAVAYVGPLGAKPRTIKLDISDDELVETHNRLELRRRWPDVPEHAAIEGYTLDEVAAEKLRCIAERFQCRDLFDLHELLDGDHVEPLEIWHLYLRKAANDSVRDRQRTPPTQWAATFERRMTAYGDRWEHELSEYLAEFPTFDDTERRVRRHLRPLLDAARSLAEEARSS